VKLCRTHVMTFWIKNSWSRSEPNKPCFTKSWCQDSWT